MYIANVSSSGSRGENGCISCIYYPHTQCDTKNQIIHIDLYNIR